VRRLSATTQYLAIQIFVESDHQSIATAYRGCTQVACRPHDSFRNQCVVPAGSLRFESDGPGPVRNENSLHPVR